MATTTTTTTTTALPASSLGPITIAVGAVFLGINAFFIGLRCYVRARISKTFNFNDVFMIVATFIYAGLFALLIFAVRNGVGGHTSSATIVGIGNALKFIFFLEIIYVVLTSIMKASLAITLLQWAKVKTHIYLLRAAILIDALICIIVVEYFLVQCAPISYTWRLVDPTAKGVCLPAAQQIAVGFALSGTTVSIDMLFLIAPWIMLKGRGVNSRLKLYIYGLFGLGVAASIANFIRLATLAKLKASTDPLFDAAPVFLWSAVEVSIGIAVAGILELRPLMRKYNVKGFEDSFDQIDEDRIPIRLQSMDKSNISFPTTREMGNQGRQF
ncbi:uncharacterized protein LY89DRAFT_280048 [Mollisia scopiformis]|uniref:Rhodopsin domain-containing protein n=1 Tax=Mollisia scopiformis TaxID=149040 RepID=A0A132B9Y5_MOLSC|nr:uncharacterized protein LY89DRAFT_280048 [Mollisia scopiformis]KUJ09215.1 hypothetical protein LY89DRAFT_280048 [Mollisia scopiformis]